MKLNQTLTVCFYSLCMDLCEFLESIAVMSIDLGSEWIKIAIVKVTVASTCINFYHLFCDGNSTIHE